MVIKWGQLNKIRFSRVSQLNCQTLESFLQLIHQNIQDMYLRAGSDDRNDLCALFFDRSSEIYTDITKSEAILSLESFRKTHSINTNNNSDVDILPRIKHIVIHVDGARQLEKLLHFFANSKCMSILNLDSSLNIINIIVSVDVNSNGTVVIIDYDDLGNVFDAMINHFDQIEEIRFLFSCANDDLVLQQLKIFCDNLCFEKIVGNVLYCLKTSQGDRLSNLKSIKFAWCNHKQYFKEGKDWCERRIEQTVQMDDIKLPYKQSCQQKLPLYQTKD